MVMEENHRLVLLVTWLTRVELVWQSSVTTVKTEHWWKNMKTQGVTHVTFITQERVCLSWRVSPESPHTVNSLSNMSVIIRFCSKMVIHMDGGCHVIQLRWPTGKEYLLVVSAHAGWPTHVWTPVMAVTVMRMTMCGGKTAVSSLIKHSFQLNSSGLETLAVVERKATIH